MYFVVVKNITLHNTISVYVHRHIKRGFKMPVAGRPEQYCLSGILIDTYSDIHNTEYFMILHTCVTIRYICMTLDQPLKLPKKLTNKVSKLLQLLLSKYCRVDYFLVLRYITKAEVSLSPSCSIFCLLLQDVYIFIFNYVKALQQSYHTGLLQET